MKEHLPKRHLQEFLGPYHNDFVFIPFIDYDGNCRIAEYWGTGHLIITPHCGEELKEYFERNGIDYPKFALPVVDTAKRDYVVGAW